MKHIKTTSSEESKAKKDYATIEPGDPVVADEKIEETANQLLKVLREIDDKKLEASNEFWFLAKHFNWFVVFFATTE